MHCGVRLHLGDCVVKDGAAEHQVRSGMLHRRRDRGEVGLGRRIDLLVGGLDASPFQAGLRTIFRGAYEGVVLLWIGRTLRALVRRQFEDVVDKGIGLLLGDGRLNEEDVFELAFENLRRAAGAFDEGHLVLLGHRRGRDGERARERTK